MKSVCLIKFFATAQTTAAENIAFSIDLLNEFLVFFWNFPDESEAFFSCSEKRFYFEYVDAQMRLTIIFTFNEEELPKEQESISVECQPPACRQFVLHCEQV